MATTETEEYTPQVGDRVQVATPHTHGVTRWATVSTVPDKDRHFHAAIDGYGPAFVCVTEIVGHATPQPLEVGQRVWVRPSGVYMPEWGVVSDITDDGIQVMVITDTGNIIGVAAADVVPQDEAICAYGSSAAHVAPPTTQTTEELERAILEAHQNRQTRLMFPTGSRAEIHLTPETESLLAVLLRPHTLAERAWCNVLKAIVTGDDDARLAAAAALADLVKQELEG